MILTDKHLDTPELVGCRIMLGHGDIVGHGCKINPRSDSPLVNSIPIIHAFKDSRAHSAKIMYSLSNDRFTSVVHNNYYLIRNWYHTRTQIELKYLFFEGYTTKLIPFADQKYCTTSIIEDYIKGAGVIKHKLKRYLENCENNKINMYFVAGNLYTSHYPVYQTFK